MMLILVFSIQNVKRRISEGEELQVLAITAMFGDLPEQSKHFKEYHNVVKVV